MTVIVGGRIYTMPALRPGEMLVFGPFDEDTEGVVAPDENNGAANKEGPKETKEPAKKKKKKSKKSKKNKAKLETNEKASSLSPSTIITYALFRERFHCYEKFGQGCYDEGTPHL